MKTFQYYFTAILLFIIASEAKPQEEVSGKSRKTPAPLSKKEDTYRNLVIGGDFADPSVIRVGDTFYAAGTSSEWVPHYPLFQSKDLINWEQLGYVFPSTPAWILSSFWAPELFYYNNTYFVYYTVKRKGANKSLIGVATAKDLRKGFTDHGIVLEHGTEAIDAFVLHDNEQLYISWKAYGLDKRPMYLWGRMNGDNKTGTALTVRPVKGNYKITTGIVNNNVCERIGALRRCQPGSWH